MELVLLPIAGIALAAAAFLGFKVIWPKNSDDPAPGTSLLGGSRPITTGQIARGVFWGMWLFTLSQMVLAAVALVLALIFGAVATRSILGG